LFRLHLGPYRTAEEARAIAERIRAQVSLSPLLVVR
jgi:PleD family two-component response regulator